MGRFFGIAGILILTAYAGSAYRFVCNGVLANGEQRSDQCGVCDEEHAARWSNPNIPVVVDAQPLPNNISGDDWHNIINASFAAWENVQGTNLRFVAVDSVNRREFGANENIHEIFWITDSDEWRKLVGSGEFGTLGATLPRYSCDQNGDSGRTIFDADLVLNGMPHINWQTDCQDEDCIAVQTTLVHELGHFFGLDHPCLMCSSSIMSARAGFDLVSPVFDDMEGLRALYPDKENIGGFGFPCQREKDCSDGYRCINDSGNSYCTKMCVNDGDCDNGAICQAHGASKACLFANAETSGGRRAGENCMRSPCIEPLVCAGAAEPNFYCLQPCKDQNDFGAKEECIKLEETLSLCVGIKNLGESCSHRELCDGDLYCVFHSEQQGRCRAPCQPTSTSSTGCKTGEQCERLEDRVELCMPAEDKLDLGEHSDQFGQRGNVRRPATRPIAHEGDTTAFGCQMIGTNNGIIGFWLVILLSLFAVRQRRWWNHLRYLPKS